MCKDNMNVEFVGIEPEVHTRNYLSTISERIQDLPPSHSFIRFTVEQKTSLFKIVCSISSQAGHFAAESYSSDPTAAMIHLERKMRKQLNAWKKSRRIRFPIEKKAGHRSTRVAI